jgi:hypothetical protein
MSSSPWEWLWNGDEDVATPFHARQCQDAPVDVLQTASSLLQNTLSVEGRFTARDLSCLVAAERQRIRGKNAAVLSATCSASAATETPRTSAAFRAMSRTYAGSARFPR